MAQVPDRPAVTLPPDDRIVLPNIAGDESMPREVVAKLCRGVANERQRSYIMHLAMLGNRSRAARASGISATMVWMWRKEEPGFQEAYDRALSIAAELHEDEMFRRASEGVLEPVYQGGELVGGIRKYSDTLLIFALKGAMPEKYRENIKIEGTVDVVGRLRAARERALGRAKK